jgi:hypothetical protein
MLQQKGDRAARLGHRIDPPASSTQRHREALRVALGSWPVLREGQSAMRPVTALMSRTVGANGIRDGAGGRVTRSAGADRSIAEPAGRANAIKRDSCSAMEMCPLGERHIPQADPDRARAVSWVRSIVTGDR